jgi:hypothetical protein
VQPQGKLRAQKRKLKLPIHQILQESHPIEPKVNRNEAKPHREDPREAKVTDRRHSTTPFLDERTLHHDKEVQTDHAWQPFSNNF